MNVDIYRLEPSHIVWLLQPATQADWEQFGLFGGTPSSETWTPPEVNFVTEQVEPVGPYPDVNSVVGIPVLSPAGAAFFVGFMGVDATLLTVRCADADLVGVVVPEVAGALDVEASDIVRFSDGRIMRVESTVFHPDVVGGLAVFRVAEYPASVYVNGIVVHGAAAAGLVGFGARQVWSDSAGAIGREARSDMGHRAFPVDDVASLDDVSLDEVLWHRVCEIAASGSVADLDAMPPAIRAFFATRLFEWEVGNGGLRQFFLNHPEPAMWKAVAAGYELFGDDRGASLVSEILTPLATRDAEWRESLRDDRIETFFESYLETRLAEYDDRAVGRHDVGRLRYVRAHPDLFSI